MIETLSFSTADLYDANEGRVVSCATQFRQYGGRRTFAGRIRTVRCAGDNAIVKRLLNEPARGDVLVVDGGGALGVALVGDMLAAAGQSHGWSGVVIHGAVRDSLALVAVELGIKALGTNPKRGLKAGTGDVDVPVTFGGATFMPGEWLYSDDDGILVSPLALL